MRVLGSRKSKGALNQNLARGRLEQIAAPYDFADSLLGIVHHHREMVGDDPVRTKHHEIADLILQTLRREPLNRIVEPEARGLDPQSDRARRASRGKAPAAGARIDPVHQIAARAAAFEGPASIRETVERFGVGIGAPALVHDLAIPVHRQSLEIAQDRIDGAGGVARGVQVLDAHQPASTAPAGAQQTAERRDE